jgi:hypothetical protein
MTREGRLVLLSGATGSVGGRLLKELVSVRVGRELIERHPQAGAVRERL